MLHNTRTVYSTESLRDAHTLRDLLAAEGVSAVVFRDPFERGATGGTGCVTIQVGAADEAAARRVVGRFEQRRLRAAEGDVIDAWPRCPQCEAPRMTCCPVCQTAGHNFPAADHELCLSAEPGDAGEPLACGCGGCAAAAPGEIGPESGGRSDALQDAASQPAALPLLTCTTCDEPFVPHYLKRCEWCGHAFPDGIEFELPDDPVEPLNARVVFVFFALAAGALAMLAWLAHVL